MSDLSSGFSRVNGQLCVDGINLHDLATEFGTPLYVYSAAAIRDAYQQFHDAVSGADSHIHFALKANSNLAVLKLLANLGAGADIVSGGEMERALAAGIAPEKIIFSGVGKTDAELLAAMQAELGQINAESPAEEAGILPGDKVLTVDGHEVTRWSGIGDTVTWRIVSSVGESVAVKVDRNGEQLTLNPKPRKAETKAWERASLRQIQILPQQTPVVAQVQPNSPAALSGLKPNDIIESVNSVKLFNPQALSQYIEENSDTDLVLGIRRKDQPVEVTLRPVMPVYPEEFPGEKRTMIGVVWDLSGEMKLTHPRPWEQIEASVMAMVNTFKALFTKKSDIGAQHLSGPVGIMRIYYLLFDSEFGWRLALWFSVLLNVNLALLNLLPIPVLDGGHIVMATVEAVFRRPIPFAILNYVQTGCALLVIGYMLYVTFFDVQDLSWKSEKPQAIYFAAPGETVPATEPGAVQ